MIRRLMRFAIAGFCLLSLLVALGTSWLWWEHEHGRGHYADVSLGGTYVVASDSIPGERIGISVMRRWPGSAAFSLGSQEEYFDNRRLRWSQLNTSVWKRFHLTGESGQVAVFVSRDTGEPGRWQVLPDSTEVRSSELMPEWTVDNLPHAAVIAPALVPPLLWSVVRLRRLRDAAAGCGWDCASPADTTCEVRQGGVPSAGPCRRIRKGNQTGAMTDCQSLTAPSPIRVRRE